MRPDNFQTREFVGTGPSIPIYKLDESEQKQFVEENITGQEAVELVKSVREERKQVDEQETDPAIHSTHCTEDIGYLLGAAGDVCDDQPTGSNRADVGRDQEPSGANGESTPEDNGLEYLIKEQAKEFTEAEQKAVDLIEGRVGDELDKLEGVE